MSRTQICLAALMMMVPAIALAGEGQQQQPQIAPELKAACRDEVHRLCFETIIPIPHLLRRCVAENDAKLSDRCRALIRAERDTHGAE